MIDHNVVYDNTSVYYGAGLLVSAGNNSLINNTITQNVCTNATATAKGAGLYVPSGTIGGANNILYGNTATTSPEYFGSLAFSYSCSSMPLSGQGNIMEDPQFVEPGSDDFHLQAVSPCIDSGNPASPLDPDGSRADMGALPFDQSGGGMLIPNHVTNYNVAPNQAQLVASLTWTNPAVTANNLPLTELSGVKLYRNNVLLTTLTNVLIGQPSTYTDNNISVPGMYTYKWIPYNSYGDGIQARDSSWIGLDIPAAPPAVTANSPANLTAVINWTAPTQGAHQGYWPAGSWDGQKIYRNGAVIATLTGTNTTYTDNLTFTGNFTYGVCYYNAAGDGPITNAPEIAVSGPAQYLATVVPFNWVEINPARPGALQGVNTGLNSDDQNVGPFNVGFAFPFFSGQMYNSVRMCSNGWASFTSASTAYVNTAIPNPADPNNMLAIYWDDMYMAGGHGAAFYYYDAPNSRFIMEWDSIGHYPSTITGDYFTFEIILNANGTIDYMYKYVIPGSTSPFPQATIGLENANGQLGVQCSFDGSGPMEPVSSYGLHFGPPSPQNVDVTLTPVNPPIQIPAQGGSFSYNVAVVNNQTTPATFDGWIMQYTPGGVWQGPMLGPVNLTVPGGVTVSRLRNQNVPGSAAPGLYTYRGYVGLYNSVKWDSSSFDYTKLATGNSGPLVSNWDNWGESFAPYENHPTTASQIPSAYGLDQNYPNPFNPATTISFALPQSGHVRLAVFDLQGRMVADLVNGIKDAGVHQINFDATNLASGMYFYRLQTDDFAAVKKMMLVK
jgi:hypothetical protein